MADYRRYGPPPPLPRPGGGFGMAADIFREPDVTPMGGLPDQFADEKAYDDYVRAYVRVLMNDERQATGHSSIFNRSQGRPQSGNIEDTRAWSERSLKSERMFDRAAWPEPKKSDYPDTTEGHKKWVKDLQAYDQQRLAATNYNTELALKHAGRGGPGVAMHAAAQPPIFQQMGAVPDFYKSILGDARENLVRLPGGSYGKPVAASPIPVTLPKPPKVRAIEINPDGTPVAKPVRNTIGFTAPTAAQTRAETVRYAPPTVPQPLTSHSVRTVQIDPMTGNPVDPRGTTQDGANREAARLALQRSGAIKATGASGTPITPAPAKLQAAPPPPRSYDISPDSPQMQAVIDGGYYALHPDERPKPVTSAPPLTVAQRNALASTGGYRPDIIKNVPPQRVASAAPTIDTVNALNNKYLGLPAYVPAPKKSAALAEIDAVAPRVSAGFNGGWGSPAPKPTVIPLAPFNVPAQSAPVPRPRPLPTVPVPRISAPAAIPLSNFNTVNPMSQIAPRVGAYFNTTPAGHVVQALTGQPIQGGLLGGLFSLFGNRQQAPNAPVAAPQAPQQPGMVSDQLSGGNSSIFTTNTLMPSSMSSTPEQKRRWFTDGY